MDRRKFFSVTGASAAAVATAGIPAAEAQQWRPGAGACASGKLPPLKAKLGHQFGTLTERSAAWVARNTTSDDSLGTCLQNEVRQWRLSPPPGGESVMMNLPFSR